MTIHSMSMQRPKTESGCSSLWVFALMICLFFAVASRKLRATYLWKAHGVNRAFIDGRRQSDSFPVLRPPPRQVTHGWTPRDESERAARISAAALPEDPNDEDRFGVAHSNRPIYLRSRRHRHRDSSPMTRNGDGIICWLRC